MCIHKQRIVFAIQQRIERSQQDPNMPSQLHKLDPRYYQILALSSLLFLAISQFDIQITAENVIALLVSTLGAQILFSPTISQGVKGIPSALISALSLCLLLRTTDVVIAVCAALIAIGSKRFISHQGQHVFNPTALALVAVTLLSQSAWISPGQWGHELYLLILIVGVGSIVTGRASRIDISLGFLLSFALLCFLRAVYLGDPLSIPLHQLSNGALLIFAFFMISDPRTSPKARSGRLLYALIVAAVSACLSFVFYQPNGPIYALIICAPIVPLLNKYFVGSTYQWPTLQDPKPKFQPPRGVHHV